MDLLKEKRILGENNDGKMKKILEQLKRPQIYLPTIGLIILLAIGASAMSRYNKGSYSSAGLGDKGLFGNSKDGGNRAVSTLDGNMYDESLANRHALGVIIENHPDSRPQFGLADAAVVYEAIAEGGITRFLALYGPTVPEKVGPVRSARTYFLDWCLEYDCFFGHVGGNIDALDLIPKIGIKDLDQFRYGTGKYGKTYYREPRKGIATEHTMFADPNRLYDIAKENSWPMTGSHPAVSFKSDLALDKRPDGQTVAITISSKQFDTSWQYDKASNSYLRSMGGVPHKDGKTGYQIKSKVLLVQEVAAEPMITRINEAGLSMTTIGTGKATLFQDGTMTSGTWKKTSQKERTVFYGSDGKEIKYNPGQRWVTVVKPGSAVTVSTPSPAASVTP